MTDGCHYCGTTDGLRPYGPGGSPICFPCMKATPEREATAHNALGALIGAAEAASPHGIAVTASRWTDAAAPSDRPPRPRGGPMSEPMPPIASALDRLHHPGRPATPPCARCAVQRHTDADTIADLRRQVEDAEREASIHRATAHGRGLAIHRIAVAARETQFHIDGHAVVPAELIDRILYDDGSDDDE